MTKLYYHKTDGGAEYLTDTFIAWKHNGKSGKEGTVTHDTKICIRLDGQRELLRADNTALTEALKLAERELTWLDRNALIKARSGGDYIEVEHLDQIRAALKQAEG